MVTFYSCSVTQEIKTPEEKEREEALKHKIKTIKIFQKDYRVGVALPEFLSQVITYNEKGWRTEALNYNDSVRVHSLIRYEYDTNGNLISSTSKVPEGGLIFREIRKYNDQKKRTELIFYLPDGTYKYRNISVYDNDGRLQQLKYYWPEGLRCVNKYSYKNDLLVEDTEYDPQGKFNYKWIYNYDTDGNLIQKIQYYPGNKITAKIMYEYRNGLLTKESFFMGETINKYLIYEYDNNKLLTSKAEFSPVGSLLVRNRYEYDLY